MVDDQVARTLLDTKGYRDLEHPVILTSGLLGVFYINTENVIQDGGEWKQFGHESEAMIAHCARMAEEHPTYNQVIDVLAAEVARLAPTGHQFAVAGGQRRDWPFSGLVGNRLGIPHISLYKEDGEQKGKVELLAEGMTVTNPQDLSKYTVIPIVDLLTVGSSTYRVEAGKELGWVPMLRSRGATVNNLVAVVSRVQGGEGMLADQGVIASSLVQIDQDFIRAYSSDPARALAYMADPEGWCADYLRENGALEFVAEFDPQGSKLPRARRFLDHFGDVLKENEHYAALETAIGDVYEVELSALMDRGK